MGPVKTIVGWLTRLDLNCACTGSTSRGVNGATPPGFASDESDHLEPNVSDRSRKIALYARCGPTEIQREVNHDRSDLVYSGPTC